MELFAKNIILAFSAFVTAFVITSIAIHLVIRLSHHLELFDPPGERKIHTGKISRLGGIGIFLGFIVSVTISPLIVGLWMRTPFSVYIKVSPKILLILPTFMVFFIGLVDDFRSIKAHWKLLVQLAGAIIILAAGVRFHNITIPFLWKTIDLGIWSWPISFIWIIGVTNAINLIDGMDGLAASVSLVGFSVYSLVFLLGNHFILSIISFVMVGTLLGYLMFNFPPARIFMGDSGSLVLGFLLAVLPMATGDTTGIVIYTPITILIIPIIDVFSAIFRRSRKRISFTIPDKEHFHHKLMALGLKERSVLIIVSCIMLAFSVPLVLSTILPFERIGGLIVVDWLLAFGGFVLLHFAYGAHKKK